MLLCNEDITKPARDLWMNVFLIRIVESKGDSRQEKPQALGGSGASSLIDYSEKVSTCAVSRHCCRSPLLTSIKLAFTSNLFSK